MAGGEEYRAKVIGFDEDKDVAVLRLKTESEVRVLLPFSDGPRETLGAVFFSHHFLWCSASAAASRRHVCGHTLAHRMHGSKSRGRRVA